MHCRFQWTAVFAFLGDLDWTNWLIPSVCVVKGGMAELLIVRALVPLAILVAVPFAGAMVFALRQRDAMAANAHRAKANRTLRSKLVVGLLRWLPVSLVLAFCFTPSVSASIFKAWHCLSYAYNEDEEYSFLAQELSVRCDGSSEYNNVLVIAWALILLWPVGMVVMYAAVLLPCRLMLLDNVPASPLLYATAFLHRDYKAS